MMTFFCLRFHFIVVNLVVLIFPEGIWHLAEQIIYYFVWNGFWGGGKGGFLGCFPHINIPHTKHTNKWSFFVWVFHHPKNRKQTKKKTDEILSFMPFCHVHHSLTQTYNAQMRFRWTNLVSFGHSCEIISQNITCFPVANWLCFLSFDSIMVDALVQRKVEMVLQHTRRRKKRHQNICRHI